jgi:hypothetical protein
MPTTDRDLCREAIRTVLAQRAGGLSDAGRVAKATADTWNRMAAQLVPVLGTLGVEALFKRSVHLTSAAFPWMMPPGEEMDRSSLPARVMKRLAGCEPDMAAQAGYSLLTTFTELLATLIGHSLTKRLLAPAWTSPSPAAEQETTPCTAT